MSQREEILKLIDVLRWGAPAEDDAGYRLALLGSALARAQNRPSSSSEADGSVDEDFWNLALYVYYAACEMKEALRAFLDEARKNT